MSFHLRTTRPSSTSTCPPYHHVILLQIQFNPNPQGIGHRFGTDLSGPYPISRTILRPRGDLGALCPFRKSTSLLTGRNRSLTDFAPDHLALPVPQLTHGDAPGQANTTAGSLCCLRSVSHPPLFHRHVCRPAASATIKGAVPHRLGFVRPPTFHLGPHDCVEGHLRRHILEPVLGHSRAKIVRPPGDQSDGAGDVRLPRMEPQRPGRRDCRLRGPHPLRAWFQGHRSFVAFPGAHLRPPRQRLPDAWDDPRSVSTDLTGPLTLHVAAAAGRAVSNIPSIPTRLLSTPFSQLCAHSPAASLRHGHRIPRLVASIR
jgi:hypothetical protein